jgi:hypothetical protein
MLNHDGATIDALLSALPIIDQLEPSLFQVDRGIEAITSLAVPAQLIVAVRLDESVHSFCEIANSEKCCSSR